MFRLAVILVLSACFAVVVSWLSDQSGQTIITWQDIEIELRTSLAIGIVCGGLLILWLAERMLRALLSWPNLISHNWRERRRTEGETALSLGMVAFAAGDIKLARKQARKAERLLGSRVLPSLLSAQTAHASGDRRAALRYFTSLAADKQTAYFGQVGLMRLHHSEGRTPQSLAAAQKALELNTKSAPAHIRLLADELASQDWQAALMRVDILRAADKSATSALSLFPATSSASPHPDISSSAYDTEGPLKGQLSDLNLLAAHLALRLARQHLRHDADKALKWLKRAQTAHAGIVEIWLRLGQLQDNRAAIKSLEAGFMRCPHPDIALALKQQSSDNEGQHIARLGRLASKSEHQIQAQMVMAARALDCGIWAAAQATLEAIASDNRDTQFYLLAARLAEARAASGEDEASFISRDDALMAAAHAPSGWGWVCTSCGHQTAVMEDDCSVCSVTGQSQWMSASGKGAVVHSLQDAAQLK